MGIDEERMDERALGTLDEVVDGLAQTVSRRVRGTATSLTVLNEKGGVGKTTIVTTLACAWAIMGLRVVVIDGDSQGNATLALGVKPAPGLYDLMIRDAEFREVLKPARWQQISGQPIDGELWVVPGNVETRGIMATRPNPLVLRERLDELVDWADVVIADTGPTASDIHLALYMATNAILFPTSCALLSLDGLAKSILHKDAAEAKRLTNGSREIVNVGIVPTMYRQNTEAHDVGIMQLRERYRRLVHPPLPLRTVWEKASWAGESIFAYAPEDVAALEAWALAARVYQALPIAEVQG